MSFTKGVYKTEAGFEARVVRVVSFFTHWRLLGAVEVEPGVLHMANWDINGVSPIHPDFNLCKSS